MKKSNIYVLLFVFGLLLNACTYDFIVKEELPLVDPTVDILFASQIAPIFVSNDCIACHKTGGQAPDLTVANAYANIKSMNLVNTTTPESSILYNYPNPASSTHTWKKFSAADAQLILIWIQQGAKNN
jgi:hypothetical protein